MNSWRWLDSLWCVVDRTVHQCTTTYYRVQKAWNGPELLKMAGLYSVCSRQDGTPLYNYILLCAESVEWSWTTQDGWTVLGVERAGRYTSVQLYYILLCAESVEWSWTSQDGWTVLGVERAGRYTSVQLHYSYHGV